MGLISDGLEILKLVDKARNADLYKQIGEWIDKVIELQKQNEGLTAETNQLREQIRFKGVIERIDGHTFVVGDDEEICPRCAEVDHRAIHLMSRTPQKTGWPLATCPQCKTTNNRADAMRRQQSGLSSPSLRQG